MHRLLPPSYRAANTIGIKVDSKRKKAIRDFIRVAYLLPEYIKAYNEAMSVRAIAESKRMKCGKERELAEKIIGCTAFIDGLQVELASLSIEDLEALTAFHRSKAMKNLRMEKEIHSLGLKLHEAIFRELVQA